MVAKVKISFDKFGLLSFVKKYLVYLLFALMVVISLLAFKSYGISWDESIQRDIGITSYSYVFEHNDKLLTYTDRDYGVAFELPLIFIEKILHLTDTRGIYLMRHLATHLLFLISAVFLFKLIDSTYKNKLLATVGFFMLVLNPVLYAHSFFNSKDIPFLSVFIICLFLNYRAISNKTYLNFAILGFSTALLVNLRIMGVIVLGFTVLYLLVDALQSKKYSKFIMLGAVLIITFMASLYATWPFLWANPIGNFLFAFKNMSKFRWDGYVLFAGATIKATKIPWYYAPVWVSITTPIIYLISGLLGMIALILKCIVERNNIFKNKIIYANLIFLGCFLTPIASVIVFHSVLYDSWRQLFFIYPSFVMLAIYGLSRLNNRNMQYVAGAGFGLTFLVIGVFMVQNHPFQGVYFNEVVSLKGPEYIRHNYEFDYWCPSFKQSLEYILKTDESAEIPISFGGCPGTNSLMILHANDRTRVKIVPIDQAKYFITNYRSHPQDYDYLKSTSVYTIKVLNNTVSEVFKIK